MKILSSAFLVLLCFIFINNGNLYSQDTCPTATALSVGYSSDCSTIIGTNVGATASGETPAPSCGLFATGQDTWFSLEVPGDGELNLEVSDAGGPFDWAMSLYAGTCGSLNEIECDDDSGPELFPLIVRDDLTPGETVYLRVWEWNNNSEGEFNICAYTTASEFPIPTMGEWGLVFLGIVLLIIGVVKIKQKRKVRAF